MAIYKAIKNVTIGAGDIINISKDSSRSNTNKFLIGDTAELNEKQAKQYAVYFKKASTTTNKEAKTKRNK